jgi:hypothetical protein
VTATTTANDWRELASRGNDDLKVWLFWSKTADRVRVAVADHRLGKEFEFDVAGADALAAFNHPFAYAPSPSFGSLEVERDPLGAAGSA